MSARARLLGACVAVVVALALGVLAAWPIYESRWLLVPAAAAAVIGGGTAVLAWRLHWPGLAAAALLFVGFVLSVGPVAVPQGAARAQFGVLQAAVDGVAAVVLGWKQLLTIALPVGSYQSLLVPAYVVFLLTAFLTVRLAARGGRFAPAAALPLLAPVAFGTIFGSSALSAPLSFGPFVLSAPREVGLWGAAVLLASVWIRFSAGAERRAALRLARQGGAASTRGSVRRALLGIAVLALCATVALAAAPPMVAAAGPGHRVMLRDRIEPELIVREQVSPLAAYRASKSDTAFSVPMFEVRSSGALPARLRLAVLDAYDGVDFHVGRADADRFARLPSAVPPVSAADVEVRVGPGYTGIWAPTAALGGVPEFTGPRAGELADAFFVNRSTGAAIALPGGRAGAGLDAGDGYRAPMSTAPDGSLAGPAGTGAEFDPESMPELARWLEAQAQPATGAGVVELVQRLRERGYLSHALAQSPGAPAAWLARLRAGQSFAFVPSAGGHSISRLEQLFSDLNAQERRAGPRARPEQLVAAVGDDEQFAAAAALIARAQGFASRVVLGFRLGGAGAGVDGVPACGGPIACAGEHLAAWIEVRDASGVWVPLDVSPQTRLAPQALEQGEQSPPFPTVPEMRDAEQVDPPAGGGDRSDAAEPSEDPAAQASLWPLLAAAGLSAAALALLALPFLFLPVAKRLRRRRRRSEPEPEVRALGAWQEVRDYAVDAGADLPRQAGHARAAREIGSDAARWVAAQVEVAVFSPGGIDSRTADRVWEAADAENRARRTELSRWRRVRAAYSLRSYGIGFAARSRSARESAASGPKRGARRSVQTQGKART